ncbi:MAG: hypothetical protein M0010_00690 [Actinomycetota bacterium]|jgi:hypothetical protein|nr:hypothetical protein [Actinomycetota bacterium]
MSTQHIAPAREQDDAHDQAQDEMFAYVVVVRAKNRARADQVIAERTDYDEDYGFYYSIVAVSPLDAPLGHASARELADALGRAELLARSAVALGRPG